MVFLSVWWFAGWLVVYLKMTWIDCGDGESAELTWMDLQSSGPSSEVIYTDYTLMRFVSGLIRKDI